MKRELIIDKYGQGNAVVVLEGSEIVDLFIDPPTASSFYPPSTFVEAKIHRRIKKRGGYFVELPNGSQGFLKSKKSYGEGDVVALLSKVYFDEDKPQTFTDKLKIISKYFILKLGDRGFSFSKKIPKDFNRELLVPILDQYIKDYEEDIFIICRSKLAEISIEQCDTELDKALQHQKLIKEELLIKKSFYNGLAKNVVLDLYDVESNHVLEEDGIFERLGLWEKIVSLCQKTYYIRNGPNLILEQTSAFFSIDVNSGKDLKITARELNLLASREICRLIKILGFGGKIIIDFLPCSKAAQKEIYEFFVDFFLNDNLRNKIWGWTNGGAFELECERNKSPLKFLVEYN